MLRVDELGRLRDERSMADADATLCRPIGRPRGRISDALRGGWRISSQISCSANMHAQFDTQSRFLRTYIPQTHKTHAPHQESPLAGTAVEAAHVQQTSALATLSLSSPMSSRKASPEISRRALAGSRRSSEWKMKRQLFSHLGSNLSAHASCAGLVLGRTSSSQPAGTLSSDLAVQN